MRDEVREGMHKIAGHASGPGVGANQQHAGVQGTGAGEEGWCAVCCEGWVRKGLHRGTLCDGVPPTEKRIVSKGAGGAAEGCQVSRMTRMTCTRCPCRVLLPGSEVQAASGGAPLHRLASPVMRSKS